MKLAIGTALLVLLVGTNTYAQQQEKDKEKPAPQQQKKQEPAANQHPQAQEQQKAQSQQQKAQHQAQEQQKNQAKQAEKERSDAAKQQQQAAKQQQQQQQQAAHREQAQNQQAQRDGGNRNARRISEQDFHARFGREHRFRVARSESRRFNYGGYYWIYNDPWPSDWAYTDDVYVDEIDGEYYLIDPIHPGTRLLIIIVD
jgi:hypothetical protein